MITSTKNYTKKKIEKQQKNPPKAQSEPQDKWQKQSYTDKITQRSIHIHTHKKRKKQEKNKKKRATKSINKSTNDNKL